MVIALLLAAYFYFEVGKIWMIYFLIVLMSSVVAVEIPCFLAALGPLVPEEQMPQAVGLVQMGEAVTMLAAPVVATLLLSYLSLYAVILLDCASFLFALAALLLNPFSRPNGANAQAASNWASQIQAALQLLAGSQLMQKALLLFGLNVFTFAAISLLFTPLILNIASMQTLANLLAVAGVGALAGVGYMSLRELPVCLLTPVLVCTLVQGVLLCALKVIGTGGDLVNLLLIGFGALLFGACLPIVMGVNQLLIRKTFPQAMHGQMFALRGSLEMGMLSLVYILVGPAFDFTVSPQGGSQGLLPGSPAAQQTAQSIAWFFLFVGFLNLMLFIAILTSKPLPAFLSKRANRS